MNNVTLCGRLVSDPQINEIGDGRKITTITLAISRTYRNENGEYETDFIPVILWNEVASATTEYCRKGDVIAIKGLLQNREDKIEVIAEKVSFLSSTNKE